MFYTGVAVAAIGNSFSAVATEGLPDHTGASCIVSNDEGRQNFAFGEPLRDNFTKRVKISAYHEREIELKPVLKNRKTMIGFTNGPGLSCIGIRGTAINGKLMASVHDIQKARQV